MAYVVTERCVDCRYTDCCAVCPVECFYEVKQPAMLVIDPGTCIDCAMCVPECPIYAIYPEPELPEPYKDWTQKNADLFSAGVQITAKVDALSTAIPLEEIHAREKAKGWDVRDPSAVSDVGSGEPKEAAAAPAVAAPAAAAPAPAAAAAAPPPPAPPAATPGAGAAASVRHVERFAARPSLKVRPGGRIRVGYRTGRVEEIRKTKSTHFADVKILFDHEEKPIWYGYPTLQTLKDQGELEVLDPGPLPGIFQLLFGDTRF